MNDNYPELIDLANEFNKIVYYIDLSRALFKNLDNNSKFKGTTIDSLAVQFATLEISKRSKNLINISNKHTQAKINNVNHDAIIGGKYDNDNNNANDDSFLFKIKIINLDKAGDEDYDDIELNQMLENKESITPDIIINKINELWKNEIEVSKKLDEMIKL